MTETIRVAAVQLGAGIDVEENLANCLRMIDKAAEEKPQLMVLPEFVNHCSWYDDNEHCYAVAVPMDGPFTAAIAAKVARPDVPVVCYAGDGGILMTGNELATAVQHDLPIVLIIANNSMYGTIRMHEEREYPGREIATHLRNPDFVAWVEAFGAQGERVTAL